MLKITVQYQEHWFFKKLFIIYYLYILIEGTDCNRTWYNVIMGTGDKLKEKVDSVMLGEAFCCHGLGLLIPIYGPQSSGLCTGLHTHQISAQSNTCMMCHQHTRPNKRRCFWQNGVSPFSRFREIWRIKAVLVAQHLRKKLVFALICHYCHTS